MLLCVKVVKLTKGDVIGRLRGMTVEDLRDVPALEFVFAKDERLLSSSASCAIHRARSSSSKKSSSSVSSVTVGCWS